MTEPNPHHADEQSHTDSNNTKNILNPGDLPEEVKSILKSLPENERPKAIQAILIASQTTRASYRSPIPPPEILKGYNSAIPNGAERILSMAEKQAEHRMELESFTIKKELSQSKWGQVLGFIIAILCLGGAVFLAYCGHDIVAGVIGGSTIVGLATIFVLGKISQNNREE